MADNLEFEGQEISEFIAAIPGVKLEAPESYQRGTYLDLNVRVRVRSVRYEEITSGKRKGDLQKVHVMAVEDVAVANTITPQQYQQILEQAAAEVTVPDEPVESTMQAEVIGGEPIPEEGWDYSEPEGQRQEATAGF